MADSDESSGSSSQNVADLILTRLRDMIKDIRNQLPDPRYGTCECGQDGCIYFCDVTQWFLPEMQFTTRPLEELYLALGELYKANNQLDQSIKVVKVPYQLNQLIGLTCSSLPRAWLLIADVYFELHLEAIRPQSRRNTDSPDSSERKDATEEASTSKATFKEYRRHVPQSQLDIPQSESHIPKFDQVAPELISGDIIQFLQISTVFGTADDYISSALHCYEEARKAAAATRIDESMELKLLKKTVSAWIQLGTFRVQTKNYDDAGEALKHAGSLLKEATDNKTRAELLCDIGDLLSHLAEEIRQLIGKTPDTFPAIRLRLMKVLSSFYSEARTHYELSQEVLPGMVGICERLAMLDIDQGKPFLDSANCQTYVFSPQDLPHLYLEAMVELSKIPWCLSNLCDITNIRDQTMQRTCLELLLGAHLVKGDRKVQFKKKDKDVVVFW